MLVQVFESPEVYLGAALVIFLVLLLVSTVLNTRPDARMEFLCDLMKDFPQEGKNGNGRSRPEVEEGLDEEPAHPMPRNIDF
jgi:hypothetical protein